MRTGALPPSPRLPRPAQTLLLWRRTIPFLDWCARRYGDCFTVWAAPFGRLVYVADPDALKEVFTGDSAVFHAGEANDFLGPVMGPHSILLLDEDEHLRQRRLMLPPFHGEAVRGYEELIARLAAAEVERWPLGEPFAVHPRLRALTLEVILRVVFGVEDEARRAELRATLPGVVDLGPVTQLLMVAPWLERVGPWRRYRRRLDQVDALLYDEIARRRRDPRLAERTDVLSLLLRAGDHDGGEGLTDAELRDELMTLLIAGHETTATALAWAFERLARHPAAAARARGDDDAFLEAVAKETLRLRPVLSDVARKLTRPAQVAGYRLPAGTLVMPGIALVQRDAAHWADPLAFRPERFLDGTPEGYTWIPFGGGRRRCLGAALAMLEIKVVLREALTRLELAPERRRDEAMRVRHITMVPARGARIVARRVAAPATRRAQDALLAS
jgi:cytochrome P450